MLTPKEQEIFRNTGMLPKKEAPSLALPPTEKPKFETPTIAEMREKLELRKLQIELDKLEKPDTNIDYYGKMLELQQKSFEAQLKMLQDQSNLKIEIEKLKLAQEQGSGDFAEDIFYNLMPLLPQLLAKNQKAPEELKGGEEEIKMLPDAKQYEEYKKNIKAGLITLEQAWGDFEQNLPQFKGKITKEQFEAEFNKIKNE